MSITSYQPRWHAWRCIKLTTRRWDTNAAEIRPHFLSGVPFLASWAQVVYTPCLVRDDSAALHTLHRAALPRRGSPADYSITLAEECPTRTLWSEIRMLLDPSPTMMKPA